MCISDYFINFNQYSQITKISGFSYNNYLVLAATAMPGKASSDDLPNYLSVFMIFGYIKGMEEILDNSEYHSLEGQSINNIFNYNKNPLIENNIYGFYFQKEVSISSYSYDIQIYFNYPEDPSGLIIEPYDEIIGYPAYCTISYIYQYILVESHSDYNCFEDPYSSSSSS